MRSIVRNLCGIIWQPQHPTFLPEWFNTEYYRHQKILIPTHYYKWIQYNNKAAMMDGMARTLHEPNRAEGEITGQILWGTFLCRIRGRCRLLPP